MAIDIEVLVAPLSEDAPSGPDLVYDAKRQEIEAAFDRPVDDGGGDDENPADWRATIALIIAQGQQTRDLSLAVYLMRAAARAGDLDLVVGGAEWLARLTEERWDDVHPQLDEVGFAGRKAPCESLTRLGEFLNPLARVPLLIHPRFGKYTGADFDRFATDGGSADGYGMFRATIEATDPDQLRALLGHIDGIRAAIGRTDSVFTARADGETGTNFKPTYEAIDKIRRAVAGFVPGAVQIETAPTQVSEAPVSGVAPAIFAASGPPGAITSRDDVARTLDSLTAYFDKFEPTSPIPLLLRRAREWISLDFLSVLEDIVPASLDDAKRILTSSRRQNDPAADGDSVPAGQNNSNTSAGW